MDAPDGRSRGSRGSAGRLGMLLAAACTLNPMPVTATAQIVALKSAEAEPYAAAFRGFNEALSRRHGDVQVKEYVLREGPARERVLAEIQERPPSLILTLGSAATSLAQTRIKEIPVVFCMVLNPLASGLVRSMQSSGNNLTGGSLDVPVKLQFEMLQSVLPSLRRIGVFYNPAETSKVVGPAAAIAAAMNLELIAIPVASAEQFTDALDALPRKRLDALWSVADSTVFASNRSVEFLLRRTLESKLPFMGLSPEFVKAGALLALSVDYRDVGLQCGEQAASVLEGQAPSALPITVPRKVSLYVNLNVARTIGIKLPQRVLDSAVVLK